MPEQIDDNTKQELIKKVQELDQEDRERRVEITRKRDFETKKIHHKMALEMIKRQYYCSHRKGILAIMPEHFTPGDSFLEQEATYLKFNPQLPPFKFDFAVIKHTFVDGKEMIKCLVCGRKWKTEDPDFDEANKMVLFSSNQPSASERLPIPLPMMPQGAPTIVATMHKGFWSRFIKALKDRFTKPKGIIENVSVEYHDKL